MINGIKPHQEDTDEENPSVPGSEARCDSLNAPDTWRSLVKKMDYRALARSRSHACEKVLSCEKMKSNLMGRRERKAEDSAAVRKTSHLPTRDTWAAKFFSLSSTPV